MHFYQDQFISHALTFVKLHNVMHIYIPLYADTNGQKTALFSYIAENHKALSVTWGTIANTLDEILEMKDLAQTIREKFHCDTCGETVHGDTHFLHA